MAVLNFPGVYIREHDQSDYVPAAGATVLGLVGVAEKGPLHQPRLITSKAELISVFGNPPDMSGGKNEQQLLAVSKRTTNLTFYIAFNGETSDLVTWDSSTVAAADILSAINSIASLASKVTVTGPVGGPFLLTFTGATGTSPVAHRPQPLFSFTVADSDDPDAYPTIRRVTPGTSVPGDYAMQAALLYLNAGTALYFVRTCQRDASSGSWLAATAHTQSSASQSGAMKFGAVNVVEPLLVEALTPGAWGNDLSVKITKLEGGVNKKIRLTFSGTNMAGTFTLAWGGNAASAAKVFKNTSTAVTAANLKSYIEALAGWGDDLDVDAAAATVTVTGDTATATGAVFDIEFTGGYAHKSDLPELTVNTSGLTGTNVTYLQSLLVPGRSYGSNVYRLDVLRTIDDEGNTAVVESYERLMLINDQTLLQTYGAFSMEKAINEGAGEGVLKSNYIKFNTTDNPFPSNEGSVTVELASTGSPSTYALFGGESGLNTAESGDSDDYAGAYVGEATAAAVTSLGIKAGPTALQVLASDSVPVDIIAIPGVTNAAVQQALVTLCETKTNCITLLDTPGGLQYTEVIDWHNNTGAFTGTSYKANSSFAATYWPWADIYDPYNRQTISVPPSVLMAAAFARSDQNNDVWFATAGRNRGRLPEALRLESATPARAALAAMYSNGNVINPITDEGNNGIMVWGEHTTQRKPTALDRIHVRRLCIFAQRVVRQASDSLVMEPHDDITRRQFINLCGPQMEAIKRGRGVYDYRIICDSNNNPSESIDRNELHGAIMIQPVRTAEKIIVDFTLLGTGAEFSLPRLAT